MRTHDIPPPVRIVRASGLEPVPVEGCAVCAALGQEREAARHLDNRAKVNEANAEIANHPHPKPEAE
jgi:hypothetical protein